jgi:hypothetical protein
MTGVEVAILVLVAIPHIHDLLFKSSAQMIEEILSTVKDIKQYMLEQKRLKNDIQPYSSLR